MPPSPSARAKKTVNPGKVGSMVYRMFDNSTGRSIDRPRTLVNVARPHATNPKAATDDREG